MDEWIDWYSDRYFGGDLVAWVMCWQGGGQVDGWLDRRIFGWMDIYLVDEWMSEKLDGKSDGHMEGWIIGRTDGRRKNVYLESRGWMDDKMKNGWMDRLRSKREKAITQNRPCVVNRIGNLLANHLKSSEPWTSGQKKSPHCEYYTTYTVYTVLVHCASATASRAAPAVCRWTP